MIKNTSLNLTEKLILKLRKDLESVFLNMDLTLLLNKETRISLSILKAVQINTIFILPIQENLQTSIVQNFQ